MPQGNHLRLAVVSTPAPGERRAPTVWFCGHCGARPDIDGTSAPAERVCTDCNLGLLLQAGDDAAPAPGAAFMVLDGTLSVCGLSEEAERLLATSETEAVNRHVTELLVPADAEAQGPENLAVAVTWAARGDVATRQVVVRPATTFGVRLRARIASCGPPRAALLVFD
jgi:hypothetical protein